jgi:hypothetical protein
VNDRLPLWTAPVLIAILCGLTLRIVLALLTPVSGAALPGVLSAYNDELAHANYALHVLQSGSLPPQVESIQGTGALERGRFENYQPPLYYMLVAGLGKAFSITRLEDLVLVGRFLGIFLFLGLLWIAVLISRAASLDNRFTGAALIFVALSGVFVRYTSLLGNEPLFWLFAGGMILITIRMWQDGFRLAHWMTFAALSCLAIYTKLTAVLLLPLPVLALAHHWKPRLTVSLAGLYCIILVCVFPLWLRNFYSFGSLLPLNAGFGDPSWRMPNLSTAIYAARSFIFPWSEFWHGLLGLLFMLPFCIFAIHALIYREGWRTLVSQPVLFAVLVIAVGSFLWLNTRYDQAEGRYLFTAWPALHILLLGRPRATSDQWVLLAVLLLPYSLFILPSAGA